MSTVVSFPGLGIEVTLNRVAFSIFGIDFYWYGVLIALGALLAVWYAYRWIKEFGVDWDKAVDVILVSTICAIIGSRLYYVIFSEKGEFTSFLEIIDIRKGGVAFYGSVIGAFVSAAIVCRYHKIKIRPFMDLGSIGFLIGQGIGRWGNFINQEAFGSNTSLPWGMTSPEVFGYLLTNQETLEMHGMRVDPVMPVHPTFLYESLWCLIGLILFTLYIKKRKFDGELFLMYVAWNGAGRGVIEGLRTDSLYIGSIRVSQLLAIAGCVLAVGTILYFRYMIAKKRKVDEEYALPYGHTLQCRLDMEELRNQREKQRLELEEKKKHRRARREFDDFEEELDELDEEIRLKDGKEPEKEGRKRLDRIIKEFEDFEDEPEGTDAEKNDEKSKQNRSKAKRTAKELEEFEAELVDIETAEDEEKKKPKSNRSRGKRIIEGLEDLEAELTDIETTNDENKEDSKEQSSKGKRIIKDFEDFEDDVDDFEAQITSRYDTQKEETVVSQKKPSKKKGTGRSKAAQEKQIQEEGLGSDSDSSTN